MVNCCNNIITLDSNYLGLIFITLPIIYYIGNSRLKQIGNFTGYLRPERGAVCTSFILLIPNRVIYSNKNSKYLVTEIHK